MADLYGTNNNCSFSSSSSLESEDMSSFLQSLLTNTSTKDKYGPLIPSPLQISVDLLDSDHRFSDLNSFNSSKASQVNLGCQPNLDLKGQKLAEGRQNSNPPRSSKRTRAAEIHNMSEKRRRSRINEKLKALQTLVPNSNKTDKASLLDEAIEYLKQLQLKVQITNTKCNEKLGRHSRLVNGYILRISILKFVLVYGVAFCSQHLNSVFCLMMMTMHYSAKGLDC